MSQLSHASSPNAEAAPDRRRSEVAALRLHEAKLTALERLGASPGGVLNVSTEPSKQTAPAQQERLVWSVPYSMPAEKAGSDSEPELLAGDGEDEAIDETQTQRRLSSRLTLLRRLVAAIAWWVCDGLLAQLAWTLRLVGQNAVQKLAIASVHVFLLRHHCIALPAVCSDPGARPGRRELDGSGVEKMAKTTSLLCSRCSFSTALRSTKRPEAQVSGAERMRIWMLGAEGAPNASASELVDLSSDSAEFASLPQREERAAPERDLGFNELRLPTVQEEIAKKFHPAVCVGQALQAAITLTGLSIKVGAAMRECNAWFYSPRYAYRVNPITGKSEQVVTGKPVITNARRLKDRDLLERLDRRHPLLRIEESLRKPLAKLPTVPGLERVRSNLWNTSFSKAWDAGDELDEFKRLGETAYNVTEWDLSLANMSFSLGAEWTLEGWHYLLAHGGVIWDTRERLGNSTKSGLAVILSNSGSLALMILPRRGAPVLRSCSKFVPLRQNGTKVCNMPAPAELESLEPQTTVKIGRAATNEADSSLASLVSNMRLTGAALYEPPAGIPERHLQLHPKTHFLLHGGYLDQVSSRPLLISGARHGLMEGIVNRGYPARKLKHPAMRELQLNLFPDQDRALPGGIPGNSRDEGTFWLWTRREDAGTIAASIEADLKVCQDKKLVGMECAVDATRVVRSAGNAAKYMAERRELPVRGCRQRWFRGYFYCGGRMEGVAWELDVLGTELGSTVESCHNLDLDYRHIIRMNATKKGINWGRCAGEVASSAAYASTAGLYVASAGGFDCPAAEAFNVSKNPWQYKRLTKKLTPADAFRTDCAIEPWTESSHLAAEDESLAFTRMMFLSGAKATSAGQHCSGPSKTVCPRNIFLSLAAFAGVGEIGGVLHKRCLPPTSCCRYIKSDYVCACGAVDCGGEMDFERQKAWNTNRLRVGKCARFAGSTAKLIGSAVTSLGVNDAFDACGDDESLPAVCSSMVTFAIASLGYFAENAARSHYECPYYMGQNLYQCGQDQSRLASAVQLFASSTAAAVINCGALGGTETPCMRLVGMVHPPRRFFTV
eukprot:s2434_g4.t1